MEEEIFFGDAWLEAKFNGLRKSDPHIVCPASGQNIIKLCINPKCNNSLRCGNLNCKTCGKEVHPLCSSVSLEELT